MKFRAMIKKSDTWWIGWLVDLPGVNAQEKTREELLESLKIGAEDLLSSSRLEAGGSGLRKWWAVPTLHGFSTENRKQKTFRTGRLLNGAS